MRIPRRSRGFLQGVVGAESSFVEVAVFKPGPGSDSGLGSGLDTRLDFLEI